MLFPMHVTALLRNIQKCLKYACEGARNWPQKREYSFSARNVLTNKCVCYRNPSHFPSSAFAFHIFNLSGNQRALLLFNGLRLVLTLAGMAILLQLTASAFQLILYFGLLDLLISCWQLWDAYQRLRNYTSTQDAD